MLSGPSVWPDELKFTCCQRSQTTNPLVIWMSKGRHWKISAPPFRSLRMRKVCFWARGKRGGGFLVTSDSVLCQGKKTPWVGFLVTSDSVLAIYEELLEVPEDKSRMTFKLSQDHLKMFFSRLRRRGGWRNNPNCQQFEWALRSILQKNSIIKQEKYERCRACQYPLHHIINLEDGRTSGEIC